MTDSTDSTDSSGGKPLVVASSYEGLRRFTAARIALGRAGHSLPTAAHLAFQLDHARARDAVHLPFDSHGLAAAVQALGLTPLELHSAALDRNSYLQRPDLGRQLDASSRSRLQTWAQQSAPEQRFDLAFAVVDGLSARAVHENAVPLLGEVCVRLRTDAELPWTLAPVAVVQQGRVAVGDEICQALHANAVLVLIGERPGLSSPDSMGLYLTWQPHAATTDAQRNCISNVRAAGLPIAQAAHTLHLLLKRSRMLQLTGVGLKDESAGIDTALARALQIP
ncbi:MAG: ethanolamine ammonia-lyase subunit EutC [Rhodoferax sp.]